MKSLKILITEFQLTSQRKHTVNDCLAQLNKQRSSLCPETNSISVCLWN